MKKANAGREGESEKALSEDRAIMAEGASEIEILKPRCDKREYRRIVLPNSLEALIISDPETDKAAASMNVSVGSFSDPDGLEGLAHFLGKGLMNLSSSSEVSWNFFRHIKYVDGNDSAGRRVLVEVYCDLNLSN